MSLYQQTEPTIVSRLSDTLKAIRSTVKTAMANAGIPDPVEVLVGYPTWTEATKVWAQPIDPGFVTVNALPDVRVVTRYEPGWGIVGPVSAGFSDTLSTTSITFAAVPNGTIAGTAIHAFFVVPGNALNDAEYTAISTDTPTTVATAIKNAINALAVQGVSASSSGDVVNITGAAFTKVNICGTGQAHKEVAREQRTIQVSIWVNSPWARYQIQDAISSTLGAIDNCWLALPDGGRVLILPKGETFDDQSQESTNVYICHMTYSVEYGIVQRATATQIGDVDVTLIKDNSVGQQISEQTILIP